jgi:hypothetical protein
VCGDDIHEHAVQALAGGDEVLRRFAALKGLAAETEN